MLPTIHQRTQVDDSLKLPNILPRELLATVPPPSMPFIIFGLLVLLPLSRNSDPG